MDNLRRFLEIKKQQYTKECRSGVEVGLAIADFLVLIDNFNDITNRLNDAELEISRLVESAIQHNDYGNN